MGYSDLENQGPDSAPPKKIPHHYFSSFGGGAIIGSGLEW